MEHKNYTKKDIIRFVILRTIGNFLVLFTIFGFIATFGPALYYEMLYQIGTSQGVRFRLSDNTANAFVPQETQLDSIVKRQEESTQETQPVEGENNGGGYLEAILDGEKEQILVPKSSQFSLVIPKIGASSKIFENVDPSNEKDYLDVLTQGVAHAKGSAFPGLKGNTYLFAHSADNFWNVGRYNAVFYLLKELQPGDDITVFFQNKRFDYTVVEQKIVDPEDVSHIAANLGKGEQLTLQTCWPPGTTWKRLLIIAKPKVK